MSLDDLDYTLQQYDASEITPLARRNLIRATLPGFIEEGFSPTEAFRVYQDKGLGIRATDYYDISREVQGIEQRSNRIQYVRRDLIPSEAIFEPLRRAQTSRYYYVVQYDYIDEETGEYLTGWFGAETNLRASREEIEYQTQQFIADRYSESQTDISNVRVRKAFINTDM